MRAPTHPPKLYMHTNNKQWDLPAAGLACYRRVVPRAELQRNSFVIVVDQPHMLPPDDGYYWCAACCLGLLRRGERGASVARLCWSGLCWAVLGWAVAGLVWSGLGWAWLGPLGCLAEHAGHARAQ